jgi:hypothetical protein
VVARAGGRGRGSGSNTLRFLCYGNENVLESGHDGYTTLSTLGTFESFYGI